MSFRSHIACLAAALWASAFASQMPISLHDITGVGFALSDRYGVSTAWFPDGTSINIAKVEGGHRFKQYMRTMANPEECCPLPDVVRQHFLFNARPSSPLFPMLSALKAATEAALEEGVGVVHVAFTRLPNSLEGREILDRELKIALSQASLKTYRSALYSGEFAARAHTQSGQCSDPYETAAEQEDDPPKIILTVENTREALTTMLLEEDCGAYFVVREGHSYDLGQDAINRCRTRSSSEPCDMKLAEAFQEITRLPIKDGEDLFGGIDVVVVFGEDGRDEKMNLVLRKVLQGEHVANRIDTLPESGSVDVAFAASRGVAEYDWVVKNNVGR